MYEQKDVKFLKFYVYMFVASSNDAALVESRVANFTECITL